MIVRLATSDANSIDPLSIDRRIDPRARVIMAVHYNAAALRGLPLELFGKAVTNEGAFWALHRDRPLRMHPCCHEADMYNDGG